MWLLSRHLSRKHSPFFSTHTTLPNTPFSHENGTDRQTHTHTHTQKYTHTHDHTHHTHDHPPTHTPHTPSKVSRRKGTRKHIAGEHTQTHTDVVSVQTLECETLPILLHKEHFPEPALPEQPDHFVPLGLAQRLACVVV